MHSFVVTDGLSSSVASGFQIPRMSLDTGVMNAEPLPLITATSIGMRNGESGKALAPSSGKKWK